MSNAFAIAAVTGVLKGVLETGLRQLNLDSILGNASISALPLDRLLRNESQPNEPPDRLNLFLYQVTPNLGWRNVDYPSRDSQGNRVNTPPLAVDLHYLLTACSQEEFHAEILLGYGMQVLHEMGVLGREAISRALTPSNPNPPPLTTRLRTAGLAEQIEQIKICPVTLGTEELSKLWTAFQSHYRPTVAYQVSVVLIESQLPTRSALPVLQPQLHVRLFHQPQIAAVSPQLIEAGEALTLQGQDLSSTDVRVKVGSILVTPTSISDRQIVVRVPTGLRAGINSVQVVHPLNLGTAVEPHDGFESNAMPFVLRPTIIPPVTAVDVPQPADSIDVTVEVRPPIGPQQRVVLRLNEWNAIARPASYTAIAQDRDTETNRITLNLPVTKVGTYLVRLQVDGAESLPTVNNNQFTGEPNVSIGCSQHCMRVSDISLQVSTNGDLIEGTISIRGENNGAVEGVSVEIVWVLPDSSTREDKLLTDPEGRCHTDISRYGPGAYTLRIVDLHRAGHRFNAPASTLSQSITV